MHRPLGTSAKILWGGLTIMKLLLLSDLHFGLEKDIDAIAKRDNIMKALLEVKELSTIDAVIITGDVSWQCSQEGYTAAETWLLQLRTKLKHDTPIVCCCGNHDIVRREIQQCNYTDDVATVSNALSVAQLDILERRFSLFISFCERISAQPLSLLGKKNYLVGSAKIGSLNLWVFNTSWYALKAKEYDLGKLWIGRNFYDAVYHDKCEGFSLCLMHHPREWINSNELYTFNSGLQKSLIELIAEDCDLCFTGHTHGNVQEPTRYYNNMLTFSLGAVFAAADYPNNFSIFDINTAGKSITRYVYRCLDLQRWELDPSKTRSYSLEAPTAPTSPAATIIVNHKHEQLFRTFSDLGMHFDSIRSSDLLSPHQMLWPVVPRPALNNIHLAQLELMKILCKDFGWSLHAIISNCGSKAMPDQDAELFVQKIKKYCEGQGITSFTYKLLDRYFDPADPLAASILHGFIYVGSKTKISTLQTFKDKKYSEKTKEENKELPVLDYILPVLQISVISTIAKAMSRKHESKPVIIAGNDELLQWREAVQHIGTDDVGMVLIPELNIDEANVKQDSPDTETKRIIGCKSKPELSESLGKGNLASWLYKLFIALPNYSDASVHATYTSLNWNELKALFDKNGELLHNINQTVFLNAVWAKIEKGIMSNTDIGE